MPLETLILYLDENHCNNRRVLAILESSGVHVERHLRHFRRGAADADWLPMVGKNGWALLTTDKRIRHHTAERRAVIEHRVAMFYFSKNDMNGQQMADALLKAIPAMRDMIAKHEPPFFAAITRSGAVYLRERLLNAPSEEQPDQD